MCACGVLRLVHPGYVLRHSGRFPLDQVHMFIRGTGYSIAHAGADLSHVLIKMGSCHSVQPDFHCARINIDNTLMDSKDKMIKRKLESTTTSTYPVQKNHWLDVVSELSADI
jgi:hypothetical protein